MRILGKRQLGELEVSELITTILLSEIAAMPISNDDIPIMHAVISLSTIVAFEIAFTFITSRSSAMKSLLSPSPSIMIHNGVINQKELRKNRISPEELLSELRLKNYPDPSSIEYAILEQNGLLSVIAKSEERQPTLSDMGIKSESDGILHIIISQGSWNEYNLKSLSQSKDEHLQYLKRKRVEVKDVFLLTIDDQGTRHLIKRNQNG